MVCARPFMMGMIPGDCGKCLACLKKRRRVWTDRLKLESRFHEHSCIATLTYDEKNHVRVKGALSKEDYQLWLKRLRKKMYPLPLRFFLAGEYGSNTFRPHYHCILFGLDSVIAGGVDGLSGIVHETWGMGHTVVREFTDAGAGYVCGYVTKKLTHKSEEFLNGREPEFTRMSLRPGIGFKTVERVHQALQSEWGKRYLDQSGDVPFSLRNQVSDLRLGRYIRGKLRQATGVEVSGKAPQASMARYAGELRRMREEIKADPAYKTGTVEKIILDRDAQKLRNIAARHKIYSEREVL